MAVTICYAAALYLSWPLLQEHLFRGRYPEIAETVFAWMVLSFVSTPLWCLHWLFRSLERFRELALVGFANMVCVLAAMTCLALAGPAQHRNRHPDPRRPGLRRDSPVAAA